MKKRVVVAQMEGGCLAGGNVRFPPSEQATRRALGNLDSLACRAVQGAALASLAVNDCQACMGESRGGNPFRQGRPGQH